MHLALADIHYSWQQETVIEKLYKAGKCVKEDYEKLKLTVNDLLNHADIVPYFTDEWEVKTEKEILEVGEQKFYRAKTFSDVAPGTAFWYENSIGLAEISVNQGRADQLGLKIGTNVTISKNKSKY